MRLPAVMVAAVFSLAGSAPSVITSCDISLDMEGDTLVRTFEFTGIQGSDRLLSRISWGFEPATQSVVLETAEMGMEGSFSRVPEWSVDTLTGGSLWRRSLVTAFPALREGMEVRYRVLVRDWSGNWTGGPWAMIHPDIKGLRPLSMRVTVPADLMASLHWEGSGYRSMRRGSAMEFTASDPAGTLVISPFGSPEEAGEFLLEEAVTRLTSPFPPDLREAALQAASAGADEYAQSMRARTLLCNSMSPVNVMRGERTGSCRELQSILDSRRVTPLEMAVVYAAVCTELGMTASIEPAGGPDRSVTVPTEWERFLVRLTGRDGDSWLVEPFAWLTPASWIHRPEPLNHISGGRLLRMPANGPDESLCRENWLLDAATGDFVLEMSVSGWFDMELRRRIAGIPAGELLLQLAEWSWTSGRTVVPRSVESSDPFDLEDEMVLRVTGSAWNRGSSDIFAELLPVLSWERPDTVPGAVIVTWTLEGSAFAWASGDLSIRREAGRTILSDTSAHTAPAPVILEIEP